MSAPRSDPLLARAVAPLIGSLWALFVVWSVLVAVVWTTGLGDVQLAEHVRNPDLRAALSRLLHALDAIWITLAAVNIYLALARAEGLATARRWSALVLLAGLAIPAASALTRFPLGPVFYPGNLGMKLGPVPFALPLLWLLIVVGARDFAQTAMPRASHYATAILAGGIAALTDFNLEPLAWKWRAWWLWYPANLDASSVASLPPARNLVTWMFTANLLAYLMRSPHVLPRLARRPFEPIAALAILNAVCLLTHLVLFLRR